MPNDGGATCGTVDTSCCVDGTCEDLDGDQRLACVRGTCRSREWALWPMPSPADAGLPNPADYSILGETVLDRVTGLEWQRTVSSEVFDWEGARVHCRSVHIGEHSFRLPTRIELVSLIRADSTLPTFDDTVFPAIPYRDQNRYWTLSDAPDAESAFFVDVQLGVSGPAEKGSLYHAWCVARSPS